MQAPKGLYLTLDGPDLGRRPAVQAGLAREDRFSHHFRTEIVEDRLDIGLELSRAPLNLLHLGQRGEGAGLALVLRKELGKHLAVDLVQRAIAGVLLTSAARGHDALACKRVDLRDQLRIGLPGRELELRLPRATHELDLCVEERLHLLVPEAERLQHVGLGDLSRAALDHHDGVSGARDDHVDIGRVVIVKGRVGDELTVDTRHPHRGDRPGEGNVREHDRG